MTSWLRRNWIFVVSYVAGWITVDVLRHYGWMP